jgi:NADH:ubiquinone oxidoreductase subunit F (NADH-binding)
VRRQRWTGPGAFAGRVLEERDPHLLREGREIAARGDAVVDEIDAARLVRAAQSGLAWLEAHETVLCAISGDVLRPGLYELGAGATIAEALAAAGGVVDGVRTSTPGRMVADGVTTTDLAAPAPVALVALHRRR